jgi:CRISPR-associated protein Cmr2
MQQIFFFTIGPVQSLIAQARKTHDLFAGSALLSALTQTGISSFLTHATSCKGEIVLPHTNDPNDKIPNRFIGMLECDDTKQMKVIGDETQKAVKKKLTDLFDELGLSKIGTAQEQIQNLLEIYWLFLPVVESYRNTYNKGEKMLGAIKNLRGFKQFSLAGEAGRKCIVDGERNAIVYRKLENETNTNRKFFCSSNDELHRNVKVVSADDYTDDNIWDIQQGEGISAVTYLKRKYLRKPHLFPSTAAISLLHLKNQFSREYNNFESHVKETFKHTNDQLFYTENINYKTLKYFTDKVNDESINKLHDILRPLKEIAEQENQKFLKYYAIISFDGDNMGEWFSGNNLNEPDRLLDFHKLLSKQLHLFSGEAANYLDRYGKTVFAGEDFLGFINLKYLFEVISELNQKWRSIVHEVLKKEFIFKEEKEITFSAGIVIAHYKEPLGLVLKQVKEAATDAKKGNKNSFTLTAMKHSGTTLKCTYPFGSTAILNISKIRSELEINFSSAFIAKYNQVLSHLGREIPAALVTKELQTYVSRACKIEKQPGETDEQFKNRKYGVINELNRPINHLITLNTVQNRDGIDVINEVSNLTQTFAILDFLKRKTN